MIINSLRTPKGDYEKIWCEPAKVLNYSIRLDSLLRGKLNMSGNLDLGPRMIKEAVDELRESNEKLQKDNAKATRTYLVITICATIAASLIGVIVGKALP